MKIIVVSDLHRACNSKVDNFGLGKEKLFLKFLSKIEKDKIDLLIINGDLEELFQGGIHTEKTRLKKIYKRYYKIERAIKILKLQMKVQKIVGNHDILLKEEYNLPEEIIIKDRDYKILFIHGHQFDTQYKNSFSTFVGNTATEFWGVLENIFGKEKMRKILPKLENWIEKQNIKNKESAVYLSDESYIEKALKYAKKKEVNVIVIGHTHKAKLITKDNITYINSGTWIDEDSDYVYIDTKLGILSLNKFEGEIDENL